MLAVTLLCVAAIAMPFVIYPLLLWANARLAPAPVNRADITPAVDLVICAHNEAEVIADKLRNVFELDYPPGLLTVWVASDGSTDETVARARALGGERVRVLDLPRMGKAAALNAAVASGRAPVIAFSDANSVWSAGSLRALVAPLHDPSVGGVAGDQRYGRAQPREAAEDRSGETGYWNFDRLLKRWQTRSGNVISATGAIYCIRRELFQPAPLDATDDFMVSTAVIASGRRLVFAEDAQATEPPAHSTGIEFRRKVRIISRGLRSVSYRRALLNPLRYGIYAAQLLVHKLWRRLVWIPLLILVLASPLAMQHGGIPRLVATAVLIVGALAAVGWSSRNLRRYKIFAVPAYVAMVNAACLLAAVNLVRGRRISQWHLPRESAEPPVDPPA